LAVLRIVGRARVLLLIVWNRHPCLTMLRRAFGCNVQIGV
jgi:hypothetical protein